MTPPTPSDHRSVANLVGIETAPGERRVLAVEWEMHDPLTCDGKHLVIDTTGWLNCPVSGCSWSFDPESECPVHAGKGN